METEQQVMKLIEQVKIGDAEPSSLNCLPGERWGALRAFVERKGRLPLVEALLQAGADPNFYDGVDTPLSSAAGKKEVELFLKYGADPQKCIYSTLLMQITGYKLIKSEKKRDDESVQNEVLDTMALLLQKGESIHKGVNTTGLHILQNVATDNFHLPEEAKKKFLAFLIRHGSNPLDSLGHRCGSSNESVYEYLESSPVKPSWQAWARFIRRERGWYLTNPLWAAVRKDQPKDCSISKVPVEIMKIIVKMVLNHKDIEIL